MLKNCLKKFGGVILLYVVIFVGVVLISARVSYLNNSDNYPSMVALNK